MIITPGMFVISYGDSPSLRMVRLVTRVFPDRSSIKLGAVGRMMAQAPYLRNDRSLRRFDTLAVTLDSLTPVHSFGVNILLTTYRGRACEWQDRDLSPCATYPDGVPREWLFAPMLEIDVSDFAKACLQKIEALNPQVPA